jgi:3-phenylpropionate/trans-cinnamate dioxygenase ferredoxin reductase subunit
MLGMQQPLEIIPFFWVNLAGLHMRYAGYAAGWDDTIIHGDLQEQNFVVYYVSSGRIQAALGSGKDEEMAWIEELLKKDRMPDADELSKHVFSVSDMKKQV